MGWSAASVKSASRNAPSRAARAFTVSWKSRVSAMGSLLSKQYTRAEAIQAVGRRQLMPSLGWKRFVSRGGFSSRRGSEFCYSSLLPFFPSSLLPWWEKVARTKSASDEGSLSAERDPSPVFAEFIIGRRFAPTRWRSHPLPQGERGKHRRHDE